MGALKSLKQSKQPLRILLSIGGGSGSKQFPEVAADDAKRKRFCETARRMVDRWDLDGVDRECPIPVPVVACCTHAAHFIPGSQSPLPGQLRSMPICMSACLQLCNAGRHQVPSTKHLLLSSPSHAMCSILLPPLINWCHQSIGNIPRAQLKAHYSSNFSLICAHICPRQDTV